MHAAYKLYVTDDALSSGTERVRNCSWSKEPYTCRHKLLAFKAADLQMLKK